MSHIPRVKAGGWLIDLDYSTSTKLCRRLYRLVDDPPGQGAARVMWGGIDGQLRTGPEGGGSCELAGAMVAPRGGAQLPPQVKPWLCLLIRSEDAVMRVAAESEAEAIIWYQSLHLIADLAEKERMFSTYIEKRGTTATGADLLYGESSFELPPDPEGVPEPPQSPPLPHVRGMISAPEDYMVGGCRPVSPDTPQTPAENRYGLPVNDYVMPPRMNYAGPGGDSRAGDSLGAEAFVDEWSEGCGPLDDVVGDEDGVDIREDIADMFSQDVISSFFSGNGLSRCSLHHIHPSPNPNPTCRSR